jgi:hypothetical protein
MVAGDLIGDGSPDIVNDAGAVLFNRNIWP